MPASPEQITALLSKYEAVIKRQAAEKKELELQLARANRIIGWMMPYIGNMCPPKAGLSDLNLHCCENAVPDADKSTKGRPINQRALAEDIGERSPGR